MKNNKRSPIITLITIFSLVLSLCSGILITDNAHAQSTSSNNGKMSNDLRDLANGSHANDKVSVIIQPAGSWSSSIDSDVQYNNGNVAGTFRNFNARIVNISAKAAANMASRSDINFIS